VTNDRTADSEGDTVATIEQVEHRYGEHTVLEDLSYAIESGTVTALVGPNGSGKTTLLRIVAGLLSPSDGRVKLPASERPVGYLPQHPTFRSSFTVEETLRFYADLLEADVDVEDVLETVGLLTFRDRRVGALSGGMGRLLGIGRAIVGRPPLVVLDEPTSDLDPNMTEHVFDVITDLGDGGLGVLLATHDLHGADAADTVAVLDRGTFVETGSPETILEETGTESLLEAFSAIVDDGEFTFRRDGRNGE
jgi:ABC-type multidrug transport system ATPase subunit